MNRAASQFHVPLRESRFHHGQLVKLDGSPATYRVAGFEGSTVLLRHMSGKRAGYWPEYMVKPAGEARL